MTRTRTRISRTAGVAAAAAVAALALSPGQASASGPPSAPTAPGVACGVVTVLNPGEQIARSLVPPTIKYSVADCGTAPLAATVTITEAPGRMSDTCPSPTAGPIPVTVNRGAKVTATAPVFRASCGFAGGAAGPVTAGAQNWQDHVLALTLTDNTSGATLSSSQFFWQDAPFTHP